MTEAAKALRALVVEDSSSMRRLLAGILTERGHTVVTTGMAEPALEAHRHQPFDLMLVDWTLPGMSGLALTRAIRALPDGDDVVIIVITGRTRNEELNAVLEAGASDYLPKPLDADFLHTRLTVAERQARAAQLRRRTENALKESERRFERMVENLPGVVFQVAIGPGDHTELIYVSEGRTTHPDGLPAGESGWNFQTLVDTAPADAKEEFVRWARTLEPRNRTRLVPLADGTNRWVQVLSRPTRTPNGNILVDGLVIDITEQRRAEEALRQSETAFRTLIENSPDGLAVLRNGQTRYVNPTLVRYLGYDSPDELLPLSIASLVHPEQQAFVAESLARPSDRPTGTKEVKLLRRDGGVVVAELVSMPITYHGEPSILVHVRDLTDRKQMQSRLLLADRMASVGTLAAGMAHELNNPLAYVLSNLRMLREEFTTLTSDLPQERFGALKELIEESSHGAERMASIVRDLKTFSRVDDERHDAVEIAPILESSLNMCRNELRQRATIEKELGPTPRVAVNESRLGQVFLNLLINAAQALPEHSSHRNRVWVRTRTDEDGFAIFEVEDNGEGIDSENIRRIFDPFFTTKEPGDGTGLGLAICQNIVSAAGGSIHVESTPGMGTRFRVRLPAALPGSERPKSFVAAQRDPHRKARVLIVDDEPLVARAIHRALREHDVDIVSSGREGIDHLQGHLHYDVIFCDLMMPDVSGIEVYEEIRRSDPKLAERFVFMTGGAFTPRARAFLEAVPNECLEKPFDPRRVRTLVQGLRRS